MNGYDTKKKWDIWDMNEDEAMIIDRKSVKTVDTKLDHPQRLGIKDLLRTRQKLTGPV